MRSASPDSSARLLERLHSTGLPHSSVSRQARDDWCHLLSIGHGRRNIGEAVALPHLQKLLADLLFGAHQVVYAFEQYLCAHPRKGGERLHSFQAILFCQSYCQDWDTQLEFFKSRACCFAHPVDPSSYSDLICPSQIETSVRQSPGHNANDIGVTSGRREHKLSAAPHVERRARPLERLWQTQALD